MAFMIDGTDYCEPNPCRNNGQCRSKDNGFECSCVTTYYGTTCEQRMKSRIGNCFIAEEFIYKS